VAITYPMNQDTSKNLNKAVNALKSGDRALARELILAEVKQDPSNLTAWLWALEVAANEKEKRTILSRILKLDPNHKGALLYLKKLDEQESFETSQQSHPASINEDRQDKKISRLGGLYRLFIDWLATLPVGCGIMFLVVIAAAAGIFYYRVNTSFFGVAGSDFDDLVISNSYEKIESSEFYWEVQFEGVSTSKYIGTVRHVSPIRIKEFKILTHDVLITTVDFADPEIVDTNVIDHKFFWKSTSTDSPTGSINLIHAIPANKDIYQMMLNIQNWDIVKLTGREVYTLKAYQPDGTFIGTWSDTGCNTLLVDSVSVLKAP
jgi:hypothetical protein